MPAFWQIGQFQDALIPLNHILEADEHYLGFISIWLVAAMKLPTATLIVVVIVVISFMHNVCDPVTTFKYASVRQHRDIGWVFELPFRHRKPQIQAVRTNPSLALNRLRV